MSENAPVVFFISTVIAHTAPSAGTLKVQLNICINIQINLLMKSGIFLLFSLHLIY
jgi:hypothetical protein